MLLLLPRAWGNEPSSVAVATKFFKKMHICFDLPIPIQEVYSIEIEMYSVNHMKLL